MTTTMQGTPYQQMEWLVEQYRGGQVATDGFLRGVSAIEEFFKSKSDQLRAVPADPQLVERTLQACQRFLMAAEHLRGYAARRDEADCARALRLARQGQDDLEILVRKHG